MLLMLINLHRYIRVLELSRTSIEGHAEAHIRRYVVVIFVEIVNAQVSIILTLQSTVTIYLSIYLSIFTKQKQVIKVLKVSLIRHKAASPQQTDGSIVFASGANVPFHEGTLGPS